MSALRHELTFVVLFALPRGVISAKCHKRMRKYAKRGIPGCYALVKLTTIVDRELAALRPSGPASPILL